jgi:hypothetical protein
MSDVRDDQRLYERAHSLLRAHGIVSIVFGALGVFAFIMWLLLVLVVVVEGNVVDIVGMTALTILFFVLFLLPHVYLIVGGIQLVRSPSPELARIIVIINLVLGVFCNIVILVLSILNLTQMGDYEHHRAKHKK